MHFPISEFSAEQRSLWQRGNDLWTLTLTRDEVALRAALYPRYAGWQIGEPLPHDRESAIRSVMRASVSFTTPIRQCWWPPTGKHVLCRDGGPRFISIMADSGC